MDVGLKRELERKVRAGERLTREDGIALYESDDLAWLGALAHEARTARHGQVAYIHGAGAGGGLALHFGGWRERAADVDAMLRLREEWDGTEQAVVPTGDRALSGLEVLKTYAVARLLLDNVPHLKVFRETYGDRTAQLALQHGADEIEGPAGDEVVELVQDAGFRPVQHDGTYTVVREFDGPDPARRDQPQAMRL
jgi:aminodeoxyfutalosine synthase